MGLFSQTVTAPQTFDSRTQEKKGIDQFLANFVSTYGKQYQPGVGYAGDFTAGLSPFEGRGLNEFLTQYLNAPGVTPNLAASQDMLGKTLTGGFDPGTSQYYQALRDEAQRNRGLAIKDTNADLGGRGKFFSSEALNKYGDINANTQIGLDKTMAELADRERNRQFQAVPLAANLEQYLSGIPLQKAQAATTIGSIPRMLEQQDLESLYQDFLRRQGENKGVLTAGQGVTGNLDVIPGSRQKSTFESFVMPMIQMGISAAMLSNPATAPAGIAGLASGASGGAGGGGNSLLGAVGNQGGFWANTGY